MKITRHTAGNLSLHRISIAITQKYYNTFPSKLQQANSIFFDLFCKFFMYEQLVPVLPYPVPTSHDKQHP